MEIKAKHILYAGAFIVLTIVGTFLVPKNEELIDQSIFLNNEANMSGETIFVHIIGAINNPGIKEVPKYTRLFELIELSGGTTENADISKLNLASVLKDEQKIVVPEIIIESETINKPIDYSKSTVATTTININNATLNELILLPGIGNSMAQRIIDYRENSGLYNDIEEIKNVSRYRRGKI